MPIRPDDCFTPWYGAACCRVLEALAAPIPELRVPSVWALNGWGGGEITLYPSTAQLPNALGAVSDTQIFAGVSGTDDIDQVTHYGVPELKQIGKPLVSAVLSVTQHQEDVFNPTFWNWGRTVAGLILQTDGGAGRDCFLAGHSYGGAVVTAAAIALINSGYRGRVHCVTFGAPKLGSVHFIRALRNVFYIQWVNDHDPIPCLPPSQGEIGIPLKFVQRGVTYAFSPGYVFGPNGVKIQRDGTFASGDPDPLSPSVLEFLLHQISERHPFFRPSHHLLAEYRRRLELWDARRPPALADVGKPHVVGQPFPVVKPPRTPAALAKPAQVAAQRRLVGVGNADLDLLVARLENERLPLFFGGDSMPYVPPEYVAKKLRYATDWGVAWEGSYIAKGTRTQCLSLAKALNHFLRRLQVMEGFDLTSFNDALTLYVSEASSGGIGFKPDQLPLYP